MKPCWCVVEGIDVMRFEAVKTIIWRAADSTLYRPRQLRELEEFINFEERSSTSFCRPEIQERISRHDNSGEALVWVARIRWCRFCL